MKDLKKEKEKAMRANPLKDLARKLYEEGYTEEQLWKELTEMNEPPLSNIPYPIKCELRNYLRDITKGINNG